MPIALAAIARPLVQVAVTTGLAWMAEKLIVPILQRIVAAVAEYFGIPQDDARVVVANQVLDTGVFLLGSAAAVKSRLPLKVADYLGLTASGYAKKAVSAKAANKIIAEAGSAAATANAKGILSRYLTGENAWKVVITLMGLQQVGDWFIFGRPQLQGYLDTAFGKGTISLPTASNAPPPFTNATWEEYYTGLETAQIVGIEGGAVQASLLYSRTQLENLVWWGYSELLKAGKSPTETSVRTKIYPNLRFAAGSTATATPTKVVGAATSAAPSPPRPPAPQIQVYTGVVTNGTLGAPAEFAARPDDMITDLEDLRQAAKNNLAAFVQSLPGRFFYEVAIVNSVKTQGGFTQKGQAQRIVSGYNSNGTPRYKTVYNKFAVLKIGVTADSFKPVILGTITLGPVNAVSFQPTGAALTNLTDNLSTDLFTSDVNSIQGITTDTPVSVNPTPMLPPAAPNPALTGNSPNGTTVTQYRVTTGGVVLHLRAEADLQADILANIPDGTLLTLDPNTSDHVQDGYTWHITSYNGQGGYVAREYLVAVPQQVAPKPAATPQPSSTPNLNNLRPDQLTQYNSLVSVGFNAQAAYNAVLAIPAPSQSSSGPRTIGTVNGEPITQTPDGIYHARTYAGTQLEPMLQFVYGANYNLIRT